LTFLFSAKNGVFSIELPRGPVATTNSKGTAGPAINIAAKVYDNISWTASEVVAAVMGSAMLRERSYTRNSSH
jgi:hypothetical protein